MPTWRQVEIACSIFWLIWTGAVFYMGFKLGKDCTTPLRDYKGRFLKRGASQ